MNESIEQWNAKIVPRNTRRLKGNDNRKPQDPKAFKRASALYMQALQLRSQLQHNLTALQLALSELPEYISHGHHKPPRHMAPSCMGKWVQSRSKYQPHQGKSECARRVFQAMPKSLRAFARHLGDELFGEIGAMVTEDMDLGGRL